VKRFVQPTRAGRGGPANVFALTCALAIVATSTVPGCGSSGPEMASVSGKVTYNGKPVPVGTVVFQAKDPNGRNATGAIGSDGSYTLQTEKPGDGALLGEYNVSISAIEGGEVALDYVPPKPIKPKRLVPEKYENPETSGLTRKVESGSNTFNFDL